MNDPKGIAFGDSMEIRNWGKPTPMASGQTKRKLAAILVADIAG